MEIIIRHNEKIIPSMEKITNPLKGFLGESWNLNIMKKTMTSQKLRLIICGIFVKSLSPSLRNNCLMCIPFWWDFGIQTFAKYGIYLHSKLKQIHTHTYTYLYDVYDTCIQLKVWFKIYLHNLRYEHHIKENKASAELTSMWEEINNQTSWRQGQRRN